MRDEFRDQQNADPHPETREVIEKGEIGIGRGKHGDRAADQQADTGSKDEIGSHGQRLRIVFFKFKPIQLRRHEIESDGEHGAVIDIAVHLHQGHVVFPLKRREHEEGQDARDDAEPHRDIRKAVLFKTEHGKGIHDHRAEYDGVAVGKEFIVPPDQVNDFRYFQYNEHEKDHLDGDHLLLFIRVFQKHRAQRHVQSDDDQRNRKRDDQVS